MAPQPDMEEDLAGSSAACSLYDELLSMGFSEDLCSRAAKTYGAEQLQAAVGWALTEAALASPSCTDKSFTSSVGSPARSQSSSGSERSWEAGSQSDPDVAALLLADLEDLTGPSEYSLLFSRAIMDKRTRRAPHVPVYSGFQENDEKEEADDMQLQLLYLRAPQESHSVVFRRAAEERRGGGRRPSPLPLSDPSPAPAPPSPTPSRRDPESPQPLTPKSKTQTVFSRMRWPGKKTPV